MTACDSQRRAEPARTHLRCLTIAPLNVQVQIIQENVDEAGAGAGAGAAVAAADEI